MKQLFFKILRNSLFSIITVLTIVFSISALSAQVTQAQIEQFKKLSPAQQKSLAQQMGINLPSSNETLPVNDLPEQVTDFTSKPEDEEVDEAEDEFLNSGSQKKLKAFGYDIFSNAPSTFNPVSNIAIPEGYIIGVGDQVTLQIFGKENNQFILDVTREGQVIIPNLGPFQVAGLSFNEMKRYLVSQIKERIIGVDAVLSLSQLKSIRVFVLGDAYKPGPYNISSLSSITHALFSAGGVSEVGSLRNIQLKRSGKLIQTFDMYDLLIKGDSSKDVLLQSGDVVFVETKGKTVSVAGKVRRPAIYELSDSDNIANVLNMAGGVLPDAYKESVMVERFDDSLRTIINIDLTQAEQVNQIAKDGDYINVMEKSQMYHKSVTLIGAVSRPGKYQWQQGMTVAGLIKDLDTSILKHADLSYSLLVREIDFARNIEVYQFSLAEALSDSNSNNLILKPKDKLLIFSRVEKLSEEEATLDKLAFTQEDLFIKEKQLAKEKFQDEEFWNKYGGNSNLAAGLKNESIIDNDNTFDHSVMNIVASEEAEVASQHQSLFSRHRLLAPIIKQLIRQSSSGKPLQLVEVDGQVKFPGTYPLAVNTKVRDLIIAAGGVTESAYLERVDLTRNSVSNLEAKKENIQLNLANALTKSKEDNILLISKDRLHIHQIPSWSKNHVIELKGEFVFPGKYTIQRGDSLSDIIKRAGGFTDFADIKGSVFTREKLKKLEKENIVRLAEDLRIEFASKSLTEDGSVPYVEATKLLSDLTTLDPVGRLVIELDKVMEDNNYSVLLESGDVLYVPSKKNSVNVIGQVQVTSSHIYQPTLTAIDYINNSGGMKKRADTSRIYIISANGSIQVLNDSGWFSNSYTVAPGDTVVVPLDSDYTDSLTMWSTATTILYNTAVAVSAINGL
ncbi:SLBB domain-containing protein [Thalassotalea agariperforans]